MEYFVIVKIYKDDLGISWAKRRSPAKKARGFGVFAMARIGIKVGRPVPRPGCWNRLGRLLAG